MSEILKAGDKIFVCHCGGSEWRYTEATVEKVTPSGMVDVKYPSGTVYRFGADGQERGRGKSSYYDRLDVMPFTERFEELCSRHRADAAAKALNELNEGGDARGKWGKVKLMEVVNGLAERLERARKLVEGI